MLTLIFNEVRGGKKPKIESFKEKGLQAAGLITYDLYKKFPY